MECAICNAPKAAKRVMGGCICRKCMERIPDVIRKNAARYDPELLSNIISCREKIMAKFQPTASFGDLHIDESTGLFAVAKNGGSGNPSSLFHCLDLKEVTLSPSDPKLDRAGRVTCSFELRCEFERPAFSFSAMVKTGAKCKSERKGKEVSWDLPGDYMVFLSIFNQMLDTARKRHFESSRQKFVSKADFDLFKAETLFLLPEGYGISEVNERRGILESAFRGHEDCIRAIEEAYSCLICGLRD